MMHSEELKGINVALQMISEVAKLDPGILRNFQFARLLKLVCALGGAPEEILKSIEELQQQDEADQANQKAQQELVMAQTQASIQKDSSQAMKNQAAAGQAPLTRMA